MPRLVQKLQVLSSRAAAGSVCCAAMRRLATPPRFLSTLAAGLVSALALDGCATTGASEPAATGSPQAAAAHENGAPSSPRALDSRATFADLVRAARSLASSDLAGSNAGCLLGRDGDDYMLAADLMPSLERMPDPPTDLGARFDRADAFAVLTAWGVSGQRNATTLLAAFTATSPATLTAPPVLLVLDDERAFVRSSVDGSDASARELAVPAAITRAKQLAGTTATVYVTATATLSLEQLASALTLLDAAPQTDVALAVLLPTDTALPSTPAQVSTELCPTGLPEVDETTPLGDLSREAVMPALAGLQSDLAPCLTSLRVARTRVVIALRVGATGTVHETCFMEAGALDPRTASCVLLVAGALRTPVPNPHGVVDLHLPLTLETAPLPAQRASCVSEP
jgi:hypothetical protein